MSPEALHRVLAGGEGFSAEFKRELGVGKADGRSRLAKSLAALQDRGGYFVLGVDDDGTVIGLSDEEVNRVDDGAKVKPLVDRYVDLHDVRVRTHTVDGKCVALMWVSRHPAGPQPFKQTAQHQEEQASGKRKTRLLFRAGQYAVRDGASSPVKDGPPPRRSRAHRRVLTALAIVGAAALTGFAVWPGASRKAEPLTGDLNIAVARLTGASPSADREAAALSASVAQDLRPALRSLAPELQFAISAPPRTGEIERGTQRVRARSAEEKASDLNADLLLYGELQLGAAGTTIEPWVYVAPDKLGRAEELAGAYPFGRRITYPYRSDHNAYVRREVRSALVSQTRRLASFALGLAAFDLGRFAEAERRFGDAARAPAPTDTRFARVLELFRGHSELHRHRYARAWSHYLRAFGTPVAARAKYGLTEVTFQRSHGDCTRRTIDLDGLRRAGIGFVSLMARPEASPASRLLRIKARFGLARVYLCETQAGVAPHREKAQRAFRKVLAESAELHAALRLERSESYGYLGLLAIPPPTSARTHPGWSESLRSYRVAFRSTPFTQRKAGFQSMIGYILAAMGERPGAAAAYRRAAEFTAQPAERRAYVRRAHQLQGP